MENKNRPAFPIESNINGGDGEAYGLTKREYFAGIAMNAIISNPGVADHIVGGHTIEGGELVAKAALIAADALLKELEQ